VARGELGGLDSRPQQADDGHSNGAAEPVHRLPRFSGSSALRVRGQHIGSFFFTSAMVTSASCQLFLMISYVSCQQLLKGGFSPAGVFDGLFCSSSSVNHY
jgi:hypothetical protein